MTTYKIVEYDKEYESALKALERNSGQGDLIQLEIIMDDTLDRIRVFDDFKVYVAKSEGSVVGVFQVALVPIKVDGETYRAAMPMNSRIQFEHRNRGLAKQMLMHARDDFISAKGVAEWFSTAKTSNPAVAAVGKVIGKKVYAFPFKYLTIPTYARVRKARKEFGNRRFKIGFSGSECVDHHMLLRTESGAGLFRTDLMYRVRLSKLSAPMKVLVSVANLFRPQNRRLPRVHDELAFSTGFDFTGSSNSEISELLSVAESHGIDYLNICCCKGDSVYKLMKRAAISCYSYNLLSTIELRPDSNITLDVRCL